ncbi:MAG: aminopeptidase [Thermotogota bacterium]
MPEKNKYEKLQKKLRRSLKNVWAERNIQTVNTFTDEYAKYLEKSTTERRSVSEAIELAKSKGFIDYEDFLKKPPKKLAGTKLYVNNRGKSVAFYRFANDVKDGMNMVAAHVDSPRIDFKTTPLYEDSEFAMVSTHYYGGIKKYHWFNIPLALDGIVIKGDGETIDIRIGFDDNDPIFVISDLLPHLDRKKGDVNEAFNANTLNLIIGSRAITYDIEDKAKDPVLLNVLNLLNEKYGITEEDFFSAEIEIVPALKPRDVGFDRSMLGAYGHDDRVCSYTSLKAIMDAEKVDRTVCVLLLDKEEIGSDGSTGAKCHFWKKVLNAVKDIYKLDTPLEVIIERSTMLSGDVAPAINPNFKEVHEVKNATKLGYGMAFVKYTGVRGKGGANDADAETLGALRNFYNKKGILWQNGEMGKVDIGGGGTVAKFYAQEGIQVVDAGVPVIGMHSPYEIVSKADVYETYLAYKTFIESFK